MALPEENRISLSSSKITAANAPQIIFLELDEQIAKVRSQAAQWLEELDLRQNYLVSLKVQLSKLIEDKTEPKVIIVAAKKALISAELSIESVQKIKMELSAASQGSLENPDGNKG